MRGYSGFSILKIKFNNVIFVYFIVAGQTKSTIRQISVLDEDQSLQILFNCWIPGALFWIMSK